MLKDKYTSQYSFASNGGYCVVYYPSNIFHNMFGFENWWVSIIYLGNIWSCDLFLKTNPAQAKMFIRDFKKSYLVSPHMDNAL